jgi:site-specific recombinase XerD
MVMCPKVNANTDYGENPRSLRLPVGLPGQRRRARDPWPERDLAFIATDLLTGCRLDELLSLNLGSMDGRSGERRLKVIGKGSKERFLPIEEPLQGIIDRYLETRRERFPKKRHSPTAPLFVDRHGGRLRVGATQYMVEQCFRQAGIGASVPRGAMVHALRHTFATRLAEDGATATVIQRLMGHPSLNMSQRYIDATAQEQRAAAKSNRTYQTLERLTKG